MDLNAPRLRRSASRDIIESAAGSGSDGSDDGNGSNGSDDGGDLPI
jgi:hypothetical protein